MRHTIAAAVGLGFVAAGVLAGCGIGAAPVPGSPPSAPRIPEYVSVCDGTTGNRIYYFSGLSQLAVVNDPNCPLVSVE